MKFKYLIFLGLVLFLVTPELAEAQRRGAGRNVSSFRGFKKKFGKHRRYNSIGITANALNYFGDLVPQESFISTDISFTRPAFGAVFTHRYGPRYELRGSFTMGTLRGDDFESAKSDDENAKFRYIRNLHFKNVIKELALTAIFDLYENQGTHISRVKLTPYAFLGIAGVLHNPQAKDLNGNWVDLQPLGTEGQNSDLYPLRKPYNKFILAIPFGIGVRYKVNQNLDIAFEIGYRQTFTDYLDDVSKNYASPTSFTDADALALSDRSREDFSGRGLDTIERANDLVNVNGQDGYILGFGYDPTIDLVNGVNYSEGYQRGSPGANDVYLVTSIQLTYVLGKNYRRAKFR